MQPNIDIHAIRVFMRNKMVYTIVAVYLIVFALLGFAIYTGYSLYTIWNSMKQVDADISTFKARTELIQNNKSLIASDIDDLNSTLDAFIPDTENYFSVITALENISASTGVEIVSYSLDLESTNVSTLTLKVELVGTTDALNNFYENYMLAGGRLITADELEFENSEDGKVVVSMNFYHSEYADGSVSPTDEITQSDIDFVTDLAKKK